MSIYKKNTAHFCLMKVKLCPKFWYNNKRMYKNRQKEKGEGVPVTVDNQNKKGFPIF